MKNINEYDRERFEESFKQTETYRVLIEKYNFVSFSKFLETEEMRVTPRHWHTFTKVSAVPWYYLNWLDMSGRVIDLGCGMNFFKPYFSDIYGIDIDTGRNFFADENSYVDDDFYMKNYKSYQTVFSINSLHFHPLNKLRNICINFANLIAPGGRGFLAMNYKRMREKTINFELHNKDEIENWIRNQFENFPNKILVFDVDLSQIEAAMDGNIRIVFENDSN